MASIVAAISAMGCSQQRERDLIDQLLSFTVVHVLKEIVSIFNIKAYYCASGV